MIQYNLEGMNRLADHESLGTEKIAHRDLANRGVGFLSALGVLYADLKVFQLIKIIIKKTRIFSSYFHSTEHNEQMDHQYIHDYMSK